MSQYSDCTAACEALMKKGEVFTETDVVVKAARIGKWSQADFQGAPRVSNNAVGTKYRERKLARYGPVTLPGAHVDYARIGGKIVYADAAKGPAVFETPNGDFARMLIEDDHLSRQGRRAGTARDDRKPWAEQNLPVGKTAPTSARVRELEVNLKAAHKRIQQQEAEINRLRAVLAAQQPDSPEKIQDLLRAAADNIDEMRDRLRVIEKREEKRAQIYDAA